MLRTNNIVESWHAGLKRNMPTHPNIFVFVEEIKRQDRLAALSISKAKNGVSPVKRRPKSVKREKRIVKITEQHKKGEIDTQTLLDRARYCARQYKYM